MTSESRNESPRIVVNQQDSQGAQSGNHNLQQNFFGPIDLGGIAISKPHQLPHSARDFTGRTEEAARLAAILKNHAPGPVIVNLYGKPGVGKSALAVHVCHLLGAEFPDAHLYADLSDFDTSSVAASDQVLESFVYALAPAALQVPLGSAALKTRYRSLLHEKHCLILLDNASRSRDVNPLLAGSSGTAFVITSRRPLSSIPGVQLEGLPTMASDNAVSLLLEISERALLNSNDTRDANVIADLCGLLPLAIRITGASLRRRPHWTLARMIARLADEQTRLERLREADLDVKSNFLVSYADLSPNEAKAFRMLGLLDLPEFDTATSAKLLDLAEPETEELLEGLVEAQLLEATSATYRFHDLLRLFSRDCLEAEVASNIQTSARERVNRHLMTQIVSNLNEATFRTTVVRLADIISDSPSKIDHTIARRLADLAMPSLATGKSFDALEIMNSPRSVLIVGAPGSGKSTLLAQFANKLARTADAATGAVALLIPLRQYPQFAESIEDHLLELVRSRVPLYAAADPLRRLVSSGRIVILLDGLDEIQVDQRVHTVGAIQLWLERNTGARAILTCRAGVVPMNLDLGVWDRFELVDLSLDEVRTLAELLLRGSPTEAANEVVKEFLETVMPTELASNPLFVTFLLGLYQRERRLPRSLSTLLERYVELASERWDSVRGIGVDIADRVFTTQVLGKIALLMLMRGQQAIVASEAIELVRTESELRPMPDATAVEERAANYLSYLTERSSLITDVHAGQSDQPAYAFRHRVILEYFAARLLSRQVESPEELVDRLLALRYAATRVFIELTIDGYGRGRSEANLIARMSARFDQQESKCDPGQEYAIRAFRDELRRRSALALRDC